MLREFNQTFSQPIDATYTRIGLSDASQIICMDSINDLAKYPIVGIGASAGGVKVLQKLVEHLPSVCNVTYILVMHLSPNHPSHMADILAKRTPIPVIQANEDMHLKTNTFYIISPNHYLILNNGFLRVEEMTQPRSPPKTIDRLFISLAKELKEKSIGIILTGGDHDGIVGLKAIKSAGGIVLAQLPETALHPDMPESAIDTGLVDYILPVERMGIALEKYINLSCLWQFERFNDLTEKEAFLLEDLIFFMSKQINVSFRDYKKEVLMCHIRRRMALQGINTLDAYIDFLRSNPSEIKKLGSDFLYKITEFFREPRVWKALEKKILPEIISNMASDEVLRIWVAGCSTGEEAYSMGITALELIRKANLNIKVSIIATDLDLVSLEFARAGHYSASIGNVLNTNLLTQYFSRLPGGDYVVRKRLRECIFFTQHNLLVDPLFSNLDLISCRNFMIYLNPDVHNILLHLLQSSLKPGGFVFLGKDETVDQEQSLLFPVTKTPCFYRFMPFILS